MRRRPLPRARTRVLTLFGAAALGAATLATAPTASAAAPGTTTLTSVGLGKPTTYGATFGDTYYSAWADDGELYAATDDTWNDFGTSCSANVALLKLSGSDPANLSGSVRNCMTQYGVANDTQGHPDGKNWKVNGLTSIGGVLYMSIARNNYSDSSLGGRQTQANGSIIKSTDHGLTWTRTEQQNYDSPMFPGTAFAAPSFISYGQDGAASVDGADTYVYAVSNNGFWDNGDSAILGRVLRSKIGDLNGADWQYWTGSTWSSSVTDARPIISDPQRLGTAAVTYDAPLGLYIYAGWYYPGGASHNPGASTARTAWNFWQAPSPTGPWTPFYRHTIDPQGWYNPVLVNKFASADGRSTVALVAGDWGPGSSTYYRLQSVPLDLCTLGSCPVRVGDHDAAISYTGAWTYEANRQFDDEQRDIHYTATNGDSAEYTFAGTGVQYVAEKASDIGTADVYLDGVLQQTVDLSSPTRVTRAVAWSASGLSYGSHTIKVTKRSGAYATVDAFVVTQGVANDPAASYTGSWTYEQNRQFADLAGDIHYTATNGSEASYTFTGTGVQYVAELASDIGTTEIFLDGISQTTVDLYDPVRRLQQTVWARTDLSQGQHTIRVVKRGGSYATVDGFVVHAGGV